MALPKSCQSTLLTTNLLTPPLSPDLTAIEQIWLRMKPRWSNNYICTNEEQLLEHLDQAVLDIVQNPQETQNIARLGALI